MDACGTPEIPPLLEALTTRERAAVLAYMDPRNPVSKVEAYKTAGFGPNESRTTAHSGAKALFQRPKVEAAISAILAQRRRDHALTADEVLRQLAGMLREHPVGTAVVIEAGKVRVTDTDAWSAAVRRSIESVKSKETVIRRGGEEEVIRRDVEITFTPHLDVLREVVRNLGLHRDKPADDRPAVPSVVIVSDPAEIAALPPAPQVSVPQGPLYSPPISRTG